MLIRPFAPADLPALLAINQSATPGVSEETSESLAACFSAGTCWIADDGDALGFISLVEAGASGYPSANFSWFDQRGGDFVYVDRIALAPAARGRQIGQALYSHAFETWSGRRALICCEVNTTPPNPGSLRFHERLGFRVVGAAAHTPGVYEVAFLERAL